MAIINCPECKQRISTTSDNCIHCGAKYTYCPECGSVFLGEQSLCSECGYVIKKDYSATKYKEDRKYENNDTQEENPPNVKELLKQWKTENPFVKFFSGGLVALIGLVLLGIAAIWIFSMSQSKTMEMLSNIFSIKGLVIILIILLVLSIYDICTCLFAHKHLFAWSKNKKLNLEKSVAIDLSQNFEKIPLDTITKQVPDWQFALDSVFYNNDMLAKNIYITKTAISNILDFISNIFLAAFLHSNFIIYSLSYNIAGITSGKSDWNFSMLVNKELLIIWLALIAIKMCCNFVFKKNLESKKIEWMKANMPKAVDNYVNRMNKFSYNLDREKKSQNQ